MRKRTRKKPKKPMKDELVLTPEQEKDILERLRQSSPGQPEARPEIIAAARESIRKNSKLLHLLARSDSHDRSDKND
jgi:chorismate mutase